MNKARSNKFTIVICILAVLLVIGLCGGVYAAFFRKPVINNTAQTDTVIGDQGEILNDGKIHALPGNMLFSAGVRSFIDPESNSGAIEAIVSATVTPANANDKSVDWTLEFVDAESEWATDKTLSDYVTVTPETDGALVATVSCYQAFGEQIKLTVTSRDNPDATVTCLIDYKQQFTGMNIALAQEGKAPTVNNTTKKGTVCADFTNENPLVVTYSYLKSDVYTKALNDAEIVAPVMTVEYKAALTTALNNAKADSAKIPEVNKDGAGCSLSLFCSDFIDESYTAAEINAIISAINSNKSNAVIFNFTDSNGELISAYTFSIDTTAIQNQIRVENLSVGPEELVFGEENKKYNITYKRAGSTDGKTLFERGSEYGLSKADDGFYPETYTAGESVVISDLKARFSCSGPGGDYHSGSGSGRAEYRFNGWYLDSAKTVPFNGTIPVGTVGDITLYADISTIYTHSY